MPAITAAVLTTRATFSERLIVQVNDVPSPGFYISHRASWCCGSLFLTPHLGCFRFAARDELLNPENDTIGILVSTAVDITIGGKTIKPAGGLSSLSARQNANNDTLDVRKHFRVRKENYMSFLSRCVDMRVLHLFIVPLCASVFECFCILNLPHWYFILISPSQWLEWNWILKPGWISLRFLPVTIQTVAKAQTR